MTAYQKTEPSSKPKWIKCLCPKCRRLLCKRVLITRGDEQIYILEFYHRGMKICGFDLSIVCKCKMAVRINSKDGIIGKEQMI